MIKIKSEQYTRYEVARILGARALQLSMNAPLLLKIEKEKLESIKYDPLKIAELEFKSGVLPITVKRPLPEKINVEETEEERLAAIEEKEIAEEKKKEEKIKEEEIIEEMEVEPEEEAAESGTVEAKKVAEDKAERGPIEEPVEEPAEEEETIKELSEVLDED